MTKINIDKWLKSLCLEIYTSNFENLSLGWNEIVQLTKIDLQNIGIQNEKDLLQLDFEIQNIKNRLYKKNIFDAVTGMLSYLVAISILYFLTTNVVELNWLKKFSELTFWANVFFIIPVILLFTFHLKNFPKPKTNGYDWLALLFLIPLYLAILLISVIWVTNKLKDESILGIFVYIVGSLFALLFIAGIILVPLIKISFFFEDKYLKSFEIK